MPKESAEPMAGKETRRSFLTKLGLGAAALAAMSVPFLRLGRGNTARSSDVTEAFPGEESIFHPASDPRQDPRRKF